MEDVDIEAGSLYQIDHTHLPPDSPLQLSSIRVAMVMDMNDLQVSIRFPSISSLRIHFFNGCVKNRASKTMIPAMEELYVMGSIHAEKVLFRKISSEEWSECRHLWSFWVSSKVTTRSTVSISKNRGRCNLLSELNSTEMLKWGKRQRVKFIGRHTSTAPDEKLLISTSVTDPIDEKIEPDLEKIEEAEEEENDDDDDEEEIENDDDEEEEEEEKIGSQQRRSVLKRNCRARNKIIQSTKKKQKVLKSTSSRWSEERLKLAEESMLKVMKSKKAVAGNPILRLQLREEARRWIGDTGLLDHLLKSIAGKVAPGGVERFRRRHNPEGTMEYWLEDADLVRIRREAGVQDPFWIPPPGWSPGDNPREDPIFARELKRIKEKMSQMESDMEELKLKKNEENQAIVSVTTPRSCIVNPSMEDDSSSWLAAKEMFLEMVKRNDELEEQVMTLSHFVKDMQTEMLKLKSSSVKELASAMDQELDSEATTGTELEIIKGNKLLKSEAADVHGNLQLVPVVATQKTAAAKAAEKAARVQRLKSGFKICRPQGTFLWPDMPSPGPGPGPHDPLFVPTPTSTLSSTTFMPLPPLIQKHHPIRIKIPNINTSLDLNNAPSEHLMDSGICGTTPNSTASSFFHTD